MTMQVRQAQARGHANHGWLDSWHSFSFADYYDPAHMGFSALRVINEDRVSAGQGFGTHGPRDMEIISYVVEGALEHKDSIGTGSVINAGDVQVMSAGTGIRHSEFNPSRDKGVHFLQIWILPDSANHQPRYDQKTFAPADKRGRLRLVVSGDGCDGSLMIHQDADLYAGLLDKHGTLSHSLRAGRRGWVQMVRGALHVNGTALQAGDGLALEHETTLQLVAQSDNTEFLIFDLP
jgi:redox-sensitive bicupin YhaK (pirin superfamily)